MADIIISEFMDDDAVEHLRAIHDVIYDPALVDEPGRLAAELSDARALIVRNRTQVRGALLAAAAKLEVVGRLGVGLDNIDVAACQERGISVYPATGANNLSVAEYVVTAALMLLRRAWQGTDRVLAGEWPRQEMMGGEVAGKVIGLVGYGSIAREVAARMRVMGMTVVAHDPFLDAESDAWEGTGSVDLAELFRLSDVISLHTPLTESTRHLIDGAAIRQMKPEAVLINTARGGVVDDGALAAALREGKLAGAALDVFEDEPLTADNSAMFTGLPNIVLTPHIAGVTTESNVRVSALIAEKIADHLADGRIG